jgi:4,5-DOPA dioxygenase extradiol
MDHNAGADVGGVVAVSMPVLFIGHGSPMNAITDNVWTRQWHALRDTLKKPRAVLCVSAHWTEGTTLTAEAAPKTIHDFGGFPQALFAVNYPAPGDPQLAANAAKLLASVAEARVQSGWGFDHGAWSVLCHLFPKADVPVVQLGLDMTKPPSFHVGVGHAVQALRDDNVLIVASGNVTHNLGAAMRASHVLPPWALQLDHDAAESIVARDHDALCKMLDTGVGRAAHPTKEHYFPLLVAAGASRSTDVVSFPVTGFDHGSLSMRSVVWTS